MRRYAGKRSEGDIDVSMKAKTISATSSRDRCHGALTYHSAAPVRAMMYVDDSLPVLKSTTKSSVEARKAHRKASWRHCPRRRYGRAKAARPGTMSHRSEYDGHRLILRTRPSSDWFCPPLNMLSAFFSVRLTHHALYCPTIYSGLLMAMGSTKNTAAHTASHMTKRALWREKKKKARPTMP